MKTERSVCEKCYGTGRALREGGDCWMCGGRGHVDTFTVPWWFSLGWAAFIMLVFLGACELVRVSCNTLTKGVQ